jgi:Protein of unknown function (DUF1822)
MLHTPNTLQSEAIWFTANLPTSNTHSYSNPTAQYNAQLNQLCLQQTQAWLTEIGIASTPTFTPAQMDSIWEVVNGCALTIDNRRIILIPSDQLDREELRVPQEWVDIPDWMGDYYLAIQIDPDTNSMNIWGYSSHRTLRETGDYNPIDRTYSISSDFLITELDILWIAQILELQEITLVPPIPQLALDRSQTIIEQLSQPSRYSPRLQIDFSTWAGILNNHNLRQQLYDRRLQTAQITSTTTAPLQLNQWLQQEFSTALSQGWDIVSNILPRELAIVRSGEDMSIERAKLINLQYQLQENNVVMLVSLHPQNSTDVTVTVQVQRAPGSPHLPPQLKLSYLNDTGEELQAVISRSQDLQIQLPTFTCDLGTAFNIQLQLNGVSKIEKFMA